MLRVDDTSAAHSDIYKELGMKKYGNELALTDWKEEDEKKSRRKSDILVDNWQEGRTTNEIRNEVSRSWYSCTRCWNPQIQRQISLNLNLTVLLVKTQALTQVVTYTRCEPRL